MTNPEFDAAQYRSRQQAEWNAVSAGWEKWWPTFERGAQHVSDRLLELAAVRAGHTVLDIATGIGEPAASAARRVGPGGRVYATDQAAHMLAIARRRAAALGLENLTFQEMDGETVDTPAGELDAIVCRWGLMFLPHLPEALAAMRQRLKPGAKLAAAVWSGPDSVPSISVAMRVIRKMLDAPPPPPDAPGPFRLADTAMLARTFAAAGFQDVHSERITVNFSMPSAEAYTQFSQDISAPLVALLAGEPPARREAAWNAVTEAARAYAAADGSIEMANEAVCIVGTRR